MNYLYRVHEQHFEGGTVHVYIKKFIILKVTQKGFWIDNYSQKKFVLNSGKKRYAYLSITESINGFKRRKIRQIEILKEQLRRAERALEIPDREYIEV